MASKRVERCDGVTAWEDGGGAVRLGVVITLRDLRSGPTHEVGGVVETLRWGVVARACWYGCLTYSLGIGATLGGGDGLRAASRLVADTTVASLGPAVSPAHRATPTQQSNFLFSSVAGLVAAFSFLAYSKMV